MNDLIAQLLALTALECAAGVPPESLAALRRVLAAALIQENPGLAPVVPRPDVDPAINDAALAGAELAAERTAAGVRLRFVRETYLAPAPGAERPSQILGPFIDGDATLVQFAVFGPRHSWRWFSMSMSCLCKYIDLPMLLPRETVADAELRNFIIPAGTVWLKAERLVPGAAGFVTLRVASGTLELSVPAAQAAPGADVQLAIGATWRLTLVPEPAPPAAGGSDGNALSIELPTELAIQSDGTVNVTGALGMSGFGSALRFDAPRGGPLVADQAIVFPYEVPAAPWFIGSNRSRLATFEGACLVPLALWVLPVTQTPPDRAFEASHGGSIVMQLKGDLETHCEGASGCFAAVEASLTVNAVGIELRSRHARGVVRLALSLWGPARSDLEFREVVADLRFASRRSGADIVSLAGGRLRNRWDLPRAASGEPFACDAVIEALSLVTEPDGTRGSACAARQQAEPRVHGLALENLYLQVLPCARSPSPAAGLRPAKSPRVSRA